MTKRSSTLITALFLLLGGSALLSGQEPEPAQPAKGPAIRIRRPKPLGPAEGEPSPELCEEMYWRSMGGEWEAMKWVIREHFCQMMRVGEDGCKFWGVPEDADQVALAIEVLREPVSETDRWGRAIPLDWLARTRDPRVPPFLEEIALDREQKMGRRVLALMPLAEVFPDVAAPLLRKLARDPDRAVRLSVGTACEHLTAPAAEEVLTELCCDPERGVAGNAASRLQFWRQTIGARLRAEAAARASAAAKSAGAAPAHKADPVDGPPNPSGGRQADAGGAAPAAARPPAADHPEPAAGSAPAKSPPAPDEDTTVPTRQPSAPAGPSPWLLSAILVAVVMALVAVALKRRRLPVRPPRL